MPPLRILVQPRATYRPRYRPETINQQNRLQHYFRGEENVDGLRYPTVEIPSEWVHRLQEPFYVRLTHVTVPNEQLMERCIHPYMIDTDEDNVIKDPSNNSLYFPVSESEVQTGRKSFRFCLTKQTLKELKNHGSLRRLDSDQTHNPTSIDPLEPKRMIELYQLAQSQIRFSIVVPSEDETQLLVTYPNSSVYSHILVGTNGMP